MNSIIKNILLIAVMFGCASNSQKNLGTRLPSGEYDSSTFDRLFQLGPKAGGIDLDSWTEGFFGAINTKDIKGLSQEISKFYYQASDVKALFNFILPYSRNYSDSDPSKYYELADSLLAARRAIRQDTTNAKHEVKLQSMYLLEVLAEDVLYVTKIKFPSKTIWAKTFIDQTQTAAVCRDENNQKRVGAFTDLSMSLCPGDIMLTKGGQGSSSFLARVSDYPGNFSHAAHLYIEPIKGPTLAGKKGQILSPEAFIEDGVILRDPEKNGYVGKKAKMKKLFVYRFKGKASQMKSVISATDKFVSQMKQIQPDVLTKPSYDYDFGFEADDSSRFFCSEVPYAIYKNAKTVDQNIVNAYPPSEWGQVKGATREFFKNFLGVSKSSFPSPSDLELNPAFELVGFQFNVADLAKDRVDVAMIDSLILMSKANPELMKEYTKIFEGVGDNPLDIESITGQLSAAGMLTPDQVSALKAKMGGQFPKAINIKQLVFFGYLNEVLTPKVRTKFQRYFEPKSKDDLIGQNKLRELMRDYIGSELETMAVSLKNQK